MNDLLVVVVDGVHRRFLRDWPRVTSRREVTARMSKRRDPRSGRTWEFLVPATTLVTRTTWRAEARTYALRHGESGVVHADDSYTRFLRGNDGKVHQKRFRDARIVVQAGS